MACLTLYQEIFIKLCEEGFSKSEAINTIIHKYLDGKPVKSGKNKLTKSDYDTAFWMSDFWTEIHNDIFKTEVFTIALTRYLRQEKIEIDSLLQNVFNHSPYTLQQAIKHSQVFLRPEQVHWQEVCKLHIDKSFELFLTECITIRKKQSRLYHKIKEIEVEFEKLSPLDILVYASLFTFKHVLSPSVSNIKQNGGMDRDKLIYSIDAIKKILFWKLENSDKKSFNLTEEIIGKSLKKHMSPFLFPEGSSVQNQYYLERFRLFVSAYIELNNYTENDINWFCFSEDYNLPNETGEKSQWARNGKKLEHLSNYWFYKAIQDVISLEFFQQTFGLAENDESNRLAFIKAYSINLELQEVYGLDKELMVDGRLKVDLFMLLYSIELLSAFYRKDFIIPFCEHYEQSNNWQIALAQLALDGLINGMQNRFPITFSKENDKVEALIPWTVSARYPNGNKEISKTMLKFWTSDLKLLAADLRVSNNETHPELHERPILKIGQYLFTLPWIMWSQNNTTAAINNLRRLGGNRSEFHRETHRIELNMASVFETHGFQVFSNYEFPKTDKHNAGEIDLICFRDGHLFIFEIKSTYLRKSLKDAWHYKKNTLRKAGLQLERKKEAVIHAIRTNFQFEDGFKVDKLPCNKNIHCWIIDTSIEYDHQYFSGFLKVSLQEILIALRNERFLLKSSEKDFSFQKLTKSYIKLHSIDNLYPYGFVAKHFADIIENDQVWNGIV